jgi:hypothetical protein
MLGEGSFCSGMSYAKVLQAQGSVVVFLCLFVVVFCLWYWGLNLQLLGRCCTTPAMPPALFASVIFQTGYQTFCPDWPWIMSSWNYECALSCPAPEAALKMSRLPVLYHRDLTIDTATYNVCTELPQQERMLLTCRCTSKYLLMAVSRKRRLNMSK